MSDGTRTVDRRSFPYKARRFGRLIVTTCVQGSGAPIIDDAFTHDIDGNRYRGKAILLKNWWRKDRYGERPRTKALVIGWRG